VLSETIANKIMHLKDLARPGYVLTVSTDRNLTG
jgi:hypothetical protein